MRQRKYNLGRTWNTRDIHYAERFMEHCYQNLGERKTQRTKGIYGYYWTAVFDGLAQERRNSIALASFLH